MLAVELASVEFPARAPAGESDMFVYGQLRRQRQKLDLTRHAVVEQNLSAPTTSEIAKVNIQICPPTICRDFCILQTHPVRFAQLRFRIV